MIRIGVVEDHSIVRESLAALLETRADISVVWTARNGREALSRSSQDLPQIILMDVLLPGLNGIETTRQLLRSFPKLKIVALSAHRDRAFVAEMLSVGAEGYVLKSNAVEEMFEAIEKVLQGQMYLGEGVLDTAIGDYAQRLRTGVIPSEIELSPREREILQMIAEGLTTKQIAARLHVSIQTIATHRRHLMEKTGSDGVAQLTKFALRKGMTTLDSGFSSGLEP